MEIYIAMKKFRTLWVNGCSLSFGAEILGNMDYSTKNLAHAWPVHLAEHLGIENIINTSKCATSNISIMRSSMYDLVERDTTNMLAIVQWTSTSRTEIIYDFKDIKLPIESNAFFRENRLGITTGFIPDDVKNDADFFWKWQADKEYQDELWLTYIVSLQNFFKVRNIDYLMINGTETLSSPRVISSNLYKDIDQSKFYKNVFFKKDGTNKSSHPNLEQHIGYAKELYDYIIQIQ